MSINNRDLEAVRASGPGSVELRVRDQSGFRPASNQKSDASHGHHFIDDLIDDKVSRPYDYGVRAQCGERLVNKPSAFKKSPKLPSMLLSADGRVQLCGMAC